MFVLHRGGGGTDDGAVGGGDRGGEADVDVVVDPVVIHLDVVEMAHCVVVICVGGDGSGGSGGWRTGGLS